MSIKQKQCDKTNRLDSFLCSYCFNCFQSKLPPTSVDLTFILGGWGFHTESRALFIEYTS